MKILKKKTQHELALQIVENYLIGKDAICDAICKASTGDSMMLRQATGAIEHLTSNTVSLLTGIVGVEGLKYYTNKYGLGVSKL